jgi:hypothetical protein
MRKMMLPNKNVSIVKMQGQKQIGLNSCLGIRSVLLVAAVSTTSARSTV